MPDLRDNDEVFGVDTSSDGQSSYIPTELEYWADVWDWQAEQEEYISHMSAMLRGMRYE